MYQGMRRVGWGVRLFQGKFDFPVAQMVKRLPIMQEPRVQSLGWEDLLEKGLPMPVFLPGESPWTEEPGGLQSMRSQRVRHD